MSPRRRTTRLRPRVSLCAVPNREREPELTFNLTRRPSQSPAAQDHRTPVACLCLSLEQWKGNPCTWLWRCRNAGPERRPRVRRRLALREELLNGDLGARECVTCNGVPPLVAPARLFDYSGRLDVCSLEPRAERSLLPAPFRLLSFPPPSTSLRAHLPPPHYTRVTPPS